MPVTVLSLSKSQVGRAIAECPTRVASARMAMMQLPIDLLNRRPGSLHFLLLVLVLDLIVKRQKQVVQEVTTILLCLRYVKLKIMVRSVRTKLIIITLNARFRRMSKKMMPPSLPCKCIKAKYQKEFHTKVTQMRGLILKSVSRLLACSQPMVMQTKS